MKDRNRLYNGSGAESVQKIAHGIRAVTDVLLMEPGAWMATKYISPNLVVRATIRRSRGKVPDKWRHRDIVLSISPPNYLERPFVKDAKKAGELFPIKKVQWRKTPKRR